MRWPVVAISVPGTPHQSVAPGSSVGELTERLRTLRSDYRSRLVRTASGVREQLLTLFNPRLTWLAVLALLLWLREVLLGVPFPPSWR